MANGTEMLIRSLVGEEGMKTIEELKTSIPQTIQNVNLKVNSIERQMEMIVEKQDAILSAVNLLIESANTGKSPRMIVFDKIEETRKVLSDGTNGNSHSVTGE